VGGLVALENIERLEKALDSRFPSIVVKFFDQESINHQLLGARYRFHVARNRAKIWGLVNR
jgi:hypothetical protein